MAKLTATTPIVRVLDLVRARAAHERSGFLSHTRSQGQKAWATIPLTLRLSGLTLIGALSTGFVAWVTSKNPAASPVHAAVLVRVLILAALIGSGLFAVTSESQTRMGGLLLASGFLACLWLLNGSSNRYLFSVGALLSGLMPTVLAFLALSLPTGHLQSLSDWRFLVSSGSAMIVLWVIGTLLTGQPALKGPLMQCVPHCPANALAVGSGSGAPAAITAPMFAAWITQALGTPLRLARRTRSSPRPLRGSLIPALLMTAANSVVLVAYLASGAAGLDLSRALGIAYVALGVGLPLAFLVGLGIERLSMAEALAEFIKRVSGKAEADLERELAAIIGDPSLRIVYHRAGHNGYVDASGAPVELSAQQAVTSIKRGRQEVAVIMYSPKLTSEERFIRAAGHAALLQLEKAQLEAKMNAATSELAASRTRVLEAANDERRRLERDLHDGVQQQLTALRIKLDMAREVVRRDPVKVRSTLASLGEQFDEVLEELRLLAQGIYPPLLHERGTAEALKASIRGLPIEVTFRANHVGRYPEDVEVAIYYCCLEALQNAVKHAGKDARVAVTLWQDGSHLCFEVHDHGAGFEPEQARRGAGLLNMRDRLETVGGVLEVRSERGLRTSISGSVPVA